jgi:hypothetical protein
VFEWVKVSIAAAIGGLLTLATAIAAGWFSFATKDEELRVHLVEIAIGILRADPTKEDVTPARGWAIEVIEKKSGVNFSQEDRAALLHKPILSKTTFANVGGSTVTFVGEGGRTETITGVPEEQLNDLKKMYESGGFRREDENKPSATAKSPGR